MKNQEVTAMLEEIATLLDLQGVQFRPAAYRRAARAIERLDEDIAELARATRLTDIPGVGEGIAARVQEYLATGQVAYLAELRRQTPPDLTKLLAVPGIGPKTAQQLFRTLGVRSLDDLEKAVRNHRVRKLRGFGQSEEALLQAIQFARHAKTRVLWAVAKPIAADLVARLRMHPAVHQADCAGSVRRGKDTVGDIDLVAAASDLQTVSDAFVAQPAVREVLVQGPSKASVRLHNGLQVDLRIVHAHQFGAALQYFTGSKEHNIALRQRALDRGYKLNEYGVFDGERQAAGATEAEVYQTLGLPPIPPELREARGELEAATAKQLPTLIELKDIRGDLQTHTSWSDGSTSIGDMAEVARARGYDYLGITDHSGGLRIARGLNEEQLRSQLREIDELNTRMAPFRILKGVEANIDADGRLDVLGALRAELDFLVASVHSRFSDDRSTMTRRLLGALDEEKVTILAHPTGRLLLERPGYEADWPRVFEAAQVRGVALEINGTPNRLDLSDAQVLEARSLRCTFVVNTDAHSPAQLDYMEFGLTVARRGWLTAHEVLNTLSLDQVLRAFRL